MKKTHIVRWCRDYSTVKEAAPAEEYIEKAADHCKDCDYMDLHMEPKMESES